MSSRGSRSFLVFLLLLLPFGPAVAADFVAAADPLAAAVGRDILRRGGNAVDAAIATQLVLAVVEPQSSGLGGGAFLVYYDAAHHKVESFDGRETAPAAARPDRFIDADGTPLPFRQAMATGLSVGVPGVVRLLEMVHRRHGRLPWAELFAPAIAVAEGGWTVSPRLHRELQEEAGLAEDAAARAIYYPDGHAVMAGTRITNPALAATLKRLAAEGADAFYTGPIARDIVAAVARPPRPGDMTEADLAGYRPKQRPPVCGRFRADTLCGMGPPSSGGVGVLQILGILGHFSPTRPGADAVHLFAEAGRLAYADRARWLGDSDKVAVPTAGLVDPGYLATRAALIAPGHSLGTAPAGLPSGAAMPPAPAAPGPEHGTSHISVLDVEGDAVAMTTTIEFIFGSRRMVDGFLLNNQLTDFDFSPGGANQVEGGKRPRSSMAPTVVFDARGRLKAVAGSPGGSMIINYVAKDLVALLDWHLNPQAAADYPNFGSRNGPTEIEKDTALVPWAPTLEAQGDTVETEELHSGSQLLLKTPTGWRGGSDRRAEGAALGD